MHIFLTGATGFIGKPLTETLLRRNHQITALVRTPGSQSAQALSAAGVTIKQGDVTDPASIRTAMQGADLVLHAAGWYELGITTEAGRQMHAINVEGTANVLRLALELGIPRAIHISSIIAYGDSGDHIADEEFRRRAMPNSIYEMSKAEAHAIAEYYQRRGLNLSIIAPGGVVGPHDHSAWSYGIALWRRKIYPPLFWAPDGSQSYVHVDDLAEGIALCVEHGRASRNYIMTGGYLTVREITTILSEFPGGQRVRGYLPLEFAEVLAGMVEPGLRLFGVPAFVSRESVRTLAMQLRFSSERALSELGWQPRSAEQAWRDTLQDVLGT